MHWNQRHPKLSNHRQLHAFALQKITNQITITSLARISHMELRINCSAPGQSDSSNFAQHVIKVFY